MIVNVNGFNDGTLTGVMSSAYWLMMLLAIAPLIAIFTARRCAFLTADYPFLIIVYAGMRTVSRSGVFTLTGCFLSG